MLQVVTRIQTIGKKDGGVIPEHLRFPTPLRAPAHARRGPGPPPGDQPASALPPVATHSAAQGYRVFSGKREQAKALNQGTQRDVAHRYRDDVQHSTR